MNGLMGKWLRCFYWVGVLGISGCSAFPTNEAMNLAACGAALATAGIADPIAMIPIALVTPACQALAADTLQALIAEIAAKTAAQRKMMGRP